MRRDVHVGEGRLVSAVGLVRWFGYGVLYLSKIGTRMRLGAKVLENLYQ